MFLANTSYLCSLGSYNIRLGLAVGGAGHLIVSHRYVSKRLLSPTLLLITPLTAINVTQLLLLSWLLFYHSYVLFGILSILIVVVK